MTAVRLRITGRVQGVGYREWTRHKAGQFGLSGWVRNRADGSVEAVLAGDEAAVVAMTEACHRGPRLASVTSVTSTPAEPFAGSGFTVRETQ